MATLVLSTVGTALGGPIGAALGALVGQSIDRELIGPAERGPRMGDLAVQTSSYGTQIPRVYGTMRVAGSVVWSTNLVQSSAASGVKGQPDTVYSYSVSIAVALSSRTISAVRRIWADGKLLRGEDGLFKVNTGFRLYNGTEDQPVDPLIGSAEGIASTPAYRGLALAVFENLELAEFGNRIPFLTFEVIADDTAPLVATLVSDITNGVADIAASELVDGYAAYGRSTKSAIEPLVAAYGVELFDDGARMRSPAAGIVSIGADDWGCSAEAEQVDRLEREQQPSTALPALLRLAYYDPAREFQIADARAIASERGGAEEAVELAAVLQAGAAKSLCHRIIARRWATRDKVMLRLPPRFVALEPGSRLDLELSPRRWVVERCTLDGYVVAVELKPAVSPEFALAGDSGRALRSADLPVGELALALFDVPDAFGHIHTQPTLLLAASSTGAGWRRTAVEFSTAGGSLGQYALTQKSVLGHAVTPLGPGAACLIDTASEVEIQLVDHAQWLTSCDDDALVAGLNLAVLGQELIQFGQAQSLGDGRFRLARLLRGRAGTEWAIANHVLGERFVLLDRASLRTVQLPTWAAGSAVQASAGSEATAQLVPQGEALRPPTPVNLEADVTGGGELLLRWTRRSRYGWAWIDEIDAPLGETSERYRITITGANTHLEFISAVPQLTIGPSDLAEVGSERVDVAVRQLGDWGVSRAAQCTVTLI